MNIDIVRHGLNDIQRKRITDLAHKDFDSLTDRELRNACVDASMNFKLMTNDVLPYIEVLGMTKERKIDGDIHELYELAKRS